MRFNITSRQRAMLWLASILLCLPSGIASAQQAAGPPSAPAQFGGSYSALDERRRLLINDWVSRFNAATGTKQEPGPFYDQYIAVSTKTTFDAITFALERTSLADAAGQPLGDALDLISQVETVRGQIINASGDRQFRMYVGLKDGTVDRLNRSQQFKRGADNSVYHRGYPINYRQQGGSPSIQVSIAPDGRRADIDVDYRASIFPVSLFNGHLTSSNSDVRAGSNYDRHNGRWNGFQNWWRNFFGLGLGSSSDDRKDDEASRILPGAPRLGDQKIDLMVEDFLKAWLVEGDVREAMAYVSPRSFACLAQEDDDPSSVDRGIAPFALSRSLRQAYDALGPHASLDGLTVGVRLTLPALRLVSQPRHAQFVIYSVPDDVAAAFDCDSRLRLGDPKATRRRYGTYFGATFNIVTTAGKSHSMALLWARDDGYWKIVSWNVEPAGDEQPEPRSADVRTVKVKADPTLVDAARGFLESWLLRQDYDAAFAYVSPKAYACYELVRGPDQPAATSPADAGRKIRESLERAGRQVGKRRSVDEVVEGVQPVHPALRVMEHRYSRTFALSSVPTALASMADCSYRAAGGQVKDDPQPEYGTAFGMNVRFKTAGGEAPVLRMLWLRDPDAWRIAGYDIEMP